MPRRLRDPTDFAGYRSVTRPLLAGEVCGRETAVGRRRRFDEFLMALRDTRSVWRRRVVMGVIGERRPVGAATARVWFTRLPRLFQRNDPLMRVSRYEQT